MHKSQVQPGDNIIVFQRMAPNNFCTVIAVTEKWIVVRDEATQGVVEITGDIANKVELVPGTTPIGTDVIVYGHIGRVLNNNLLHVRLTDGTDRFVSQEAVDGYKVIKL